MRTLYFYFTLSLIIIFALVAFSFFFFEKEKHEALYYVIEKNGEKIGNIRIDQYVTEDKIVYKSSRYLPKEAGGATVSEKLSFRRKNFYLDKILKEYQNAGKNTETLIIKDNGKTLDFLSVVQSKFSALGNMTHEKDLSLFDEESIVTYIPFLVRYNFALGGSQSFNALYHPFGLFPLARSRVVFTSIRDDFLIVEGKKVKTECIVVKTKLLPISYIWVSKKDKNILKLEIKGKDILIRKVAKSQRVSMENFAIKSELYESREVLFPSGDIALAGTLLLPKKEGKLATVLLVAGLGPYNRENVGLSVMIGDALAKNGYAVLYYDKRGIGKSQGDNFASSLTNEAKDIESALKFLSNHEKVDKNRLFAVCHSEGCSYLGLLDFSSPLIKGAVLLAPMKLTPILDFRCVYFQNVVKIMTVLDKKYPQTLNSVEEETLNIVKNTKKDYAFVQRKYVFIKRMSETLEFEPLDGFKKMNMPVLIMTGKKDEFGSAEYAKSVEKAFAEADSKDLKVLCFRDLGHLFGDIIDTPGTAIYCAVNSEVLETIRLWLDDKSRPESPAPAAI